MRQSVTHTMLEIKFAKSEILDVLVACRLAGTDVRTG